MPRQPAGFSKFQRLEVLRRILKRSGKLNKQEIDHKVSMSLGCSTEQIGRALYRDLQDLVDLGFVVPTYFTRDGQLISEYDPEIHKNTYCEWSLPEAEFAIRGHNQLLEHKFCIQTSSRLIRSLWITGENPFLYDKPSIVVYFTPGGRPLSLQIDSDALPFKIIVGRGLRDQNSCLLSEKDEELFGKRTILLSSPHLGVSSFKGTKDSGHTILSFEDLASSTIVDLRSRNGTHFREVQKAELKQKISRDFSFGGGTSVETPTSQFTQVPVAESQASGPLLAQMPAQIYFSFEFLVSIFATP